MNTSGTCPECGKPVAPSGLHGLCPECMMKVGLAIQTGEAPPGSTKVVRPQMSPPPSIAEVAQLFPQLEVLECLGCAGMGVVYKARQPRLDRLVALKILSCDRENAHRDARFVERFEREARALAQLNHPNIVGVHEFGEADGLPYLIMEYVDGLNLRQLERANQLSPDEALRIVPQICEALQFAHDAGIVHRDIKPENILLDTKGRVKIADFGIAKILGRENQAGYLTEGQQVIGTPLYMAPEQVEKPQTVDHRADIYSLGVVFYEMLTGELPLGKFAPPSRRVRLDVRLDEIVLRALEKQPERRYQRASQVKTDVETVAESAAEAKCIAHPRSAEPRRITRPAVWKSTAGLMGLACALFLLAFLFAQAGRVTVTGHVRPDGGGPLAGITVQAIPQSFSVPWSDNLKAPPDPREFTAVTDQNGYYRLKGLSAEPYRGPVPTIVQWFPPLRFIFASGQRFPQEYELVVDAEDFAVQKLLITTDRGNLREVNFLLQPGAIIRGRALDTMGRLIASRGLCLVPRDKADESPSRRKDVVPNAPATDASGAFQFERVPPGRYRLDMAVYPEHGWDVTQTATNGLLLISAGDRLESHDFFFEAPEDRGAIAGRVVDALSGDSIETFSLKITHVNSPGPGSPIHGRARVNQGRVPLTPSRAASCQQGTFRVEDISPGLATVEITADGYAPAEAQVPVISSQTTNITIRLTHEGVLRGRATRNGQPCGYGYVNLRLVGEAPEAGIDAQTDALGFYEYRGLPAGEYLVRICVWLREGAFSAQVTDLARARIVAGQTTRLDLEFGRSAAIQGSFHAPDKALRWFVEVEDSSPQQPALAPPDRRRGTAWKIERTGHYSIEGLAPGTYTVTAKCLPWDEQMPPVAQQSKTILLKDGETAVVDFKFRGDEP